MMDREKAITSINKHLAKGQIDTAILECRKAAHALRNAALFNLLGDLYVKKGFSKKASEEYNKAAKLFIKEGNSTKALAIYKKLLNINPTNTAALISLGKMSAEKNLVGDAIKYYITAAHALSGEKKKYEFVKVCKAALDLDPKNAALRERIAGLLKSAGVGKKNVAGF